MIKIKNVSKHFGGVKAVNHCDFEIKKGKINALIGPNGSGKTTLFNVISNLLKSDSGEIYLDGEKISGIGDFKVSRLGISRTFQEVRFFRNLSIKDHLEIALREDDEQLFKGLFEKEIDFKERIQEVLDLVGLNKSLNTLAQDLSYGQKKLLDLAMAIIKPHKILMLDEPVAGVNPKLRKKIQEIFKTLNKKGETILIIEHDMNFIMGIADHVFVIDEGAIIAQGKPKAIQNNKKVLMAYLGE
jgi:neutral amino acid transport system ATP-binding protein